MCGIAGYFVTHPERVLPSTLQKLSRALLLCIEQRGRDSTGYAYVSLKDASVYLVKAPVPAKEFLDIEGHLLTKQQIKHMPRSMILHTRAATQGEPSNNQNNHPIYSKASGLCMVHNGWVHNDPELEAQHKLKRDAEVDTEIYLRLIEKYYLENINGTMESSIKAATKQVYGSIACAMIQGGRTHEMWVWRDSGALTLAVMDWGWVWASTTAALMSSMLFASTSFDGSVQEVIEPPQSTLYTLSKSAKLRVGKVKGAEWESLPKHLETGVFRTWQDGKLSNVRRGSRHGVCTYYNGKWIDGTTDMSDYAGEYDDLYGHGGYNGHQGAPYSGNVNNRGPHGSAVYHSGGGAVQGHSQPQLPAVVSGRTSTAFERPSGVPDSEGGESNPLLVMSRAQAETIHEVWKTTQLTGCHCRDNYICMGCGMAKQYYQRPYDKLQQESLGE